MTFVVQDHYFKRAKEENFFARSVFKLEEIQKKFHVLKSGDHVLDLGYYPGSWIQYTQKVVGKSGLIVGVDLKEVNPALKYPNVQLYSQDVFDFTYPDPFDVVLSDMAPNTSGIRSLDQDRSLNLVERVFSLLPQHLKTHGNLVIKVFESGHAQTFLKEQRKIFKECFNLRPKSTRSISKEFFFIGRDFRP